MRPETYNTVSFVCRRSANAETFDEISPQNLVSRPYLDEPDIAEKRARLGASRYVSWPAQLRCSDEIMGETNRWLEMEPLVPPVLDQKLWQCRAAGG